MNNKIDLISNKQILPIISKIDQNDEKVFSMLSSGETTGLFQLESSGMREAIKQMKAAGTRSTELNSGLSSCKAAVRRST